MYEAHPLTSPQDKVAISVKAREQSSLATGLGPGEERLYSKDEEPVYQAIASFETSLSSNGRSSSAPSIVETMQEQQLYRPSEFSQCNSNHASTDPLALKASRTLNLHKRHHQQQAALQRNPTATRDRQAQTDRPMHRTTIGSAGVLRRLSTQSGSHRPTNPALVPTYKLERDQQHEPSSGKFEPTEGDLELAVTAEMKKELTVEGAKFHNRKELRRKMINRQRQLEVANQNQFGEQRAIVQAKPIFAYPPQPNDTTSAATASHEGSAGAAVGMGSPSKQAKGVMAAPTSNQKTEELGWINPNGPGIKVERLLDLLQPEGAHLTTSPSAVGGSTSPSKHSQQNASLHRHMFAQAPWMQLPEGDEADDQDLRKRRQHSHGTPRSGSGGGGSSGENRNFKFGPSSLDARHNATTTTMDTGDSSKVRKSLQFQFVNTQKYQGATWYRYTDPNRLSTAEWLLLLRTNRRLGGTSGEVPENSLGAFVMKEGALGSTVGGSGLSTSRAGDGTDGSSDLSTGGWRPGEFNRLGKAQTKTGRDLGDNEQTWVRKYVRVPVDGSNGGAVVHSANRLLYCFSTEPWISSYDVEEAGYQQRYSAQYDPKASVESQSELVQQDAGASTSLREVYDEDKELTEWLNTKPKVHSQVSNALDKQRGGANLASARTEKKSSSGSGNSNLHDKSKQTGQRLQKTDAKLLIESVWPRMAVIPSGFEGRLASAALVRHGLYDLADKARQAEPLSILPVTGHTYWLRDEWDQSIQDQAAWLTSRGPV